MYACPNVRTQVNIVHADRNTPGFMRAPPDTPYMFALESAMDELAQRAEDGPDRAAPASTTRRPIRSRHVPYTSRHADALLRRRRGALRLVAAQPRARLDARRRLAGRLGLRQRRLSDATSRRDRARARCGRTARAGRRSPRTTSAPARYTVLAIVAADRLGLTSSGARRHRRQRPAAGRARRRFEPRAPRSPTRSPRPAEICAIASRMPRPPATGRWPGGSGELASLQSALHAPDGASEPLDASRGTASPPARSRSMPRTCPTGCRPTPWPSSTRAQPPIVARARAART